MVNSKCKLLVCICAFSLMLSMPSYALYSQEENLEKRSTVQEILEENPNALIFSSQEEVEQFFDNLAMESTSIETRIEDNTIALASTEEYNAPETITSSVNLVGSVKLHYYWTRTRGGRFWGKEYANPNISMTGYTPGIDLELVSASFYKASRETLKGSYDINFKYYLLIDGGLPLPGWKTMRYDISHTTGASPTLSVTKL